MRCPGTLFGRRDRMRLQLQLGSDNSHLYPFSVTCRRCIKTKAYRDALTAYHRDAPPAYIVNRVPRMKHDVYRQHGVYDVEENNSIRRWLGMQPVIPTQPYLDAIMADERRIYEGYRQNRARSEELDKQLEGLGITGEVWIIRRFDLATGESDEEIVVTADNVPRLTSS